MDGLVLAQRTRRQRRIQTPPKPITKAPRRSAMNNAKEVLKQLNCSMVVKDKRGNVIGHVC